jgi:hypothetical protein
MFANELTKQVALTIPRRATPAGFTFDPSLDAFRELLRDDPTLLTGFQGRLLEFIEHVTRPHVYMPKDLRGLIEIYRNAVEWFALAHEHGHLVARHTGRARAIAPSDLDGVVASTSAQVAVNTWREEVEADVLAARIVQQIARDTTGATERALIPFGVEFYFVLRRIVADASSLLSKGHVLTPTDPERAAATRLIGCMQTPGCAVETTLKSLSAGDVADARHPHPEIRRLIARAVLNLDDLDKQGGTHARLAGILVRNAELMRRVLEPRFIAAHERQQRHGDPQ